MSRKYDLVVYGATGYTGLYTAEHIASNLPTNLKWAIAGRNSSKLEKLRAELPSSDRSPPDVQVVSHEKSDISKLVQQTKVVLNCVGPYTKYGEPVVEACANSGTHYLDVTGEIPWTASMVKKYHSIAKQNGAVIIHQIGLESAPADLLAFAVSSVLRKSSLYPKEVVYTIAKMKSAPSGGTLASLISVFEKYSLLELLNASRPTSMAAGPLAKPLPVPLVTRVLGVRTVPDLGVLTTSIQGDSDVPTVYRSAGLNTDVYGNNFHFTPWATTRNVFVGSLIHLVTAIVPLFLALWPVRYALAKLVFQPGQGPAKEDTTNDFILSRAVGIPDSTESRKKAHATFRWSGSIYHLTGVLLAEGGASLLYNDEAVKRQVGGGGSLTPATLGQHYIDRLGKVGVQIEATTVER